LILALSVVGIFHESANFVHAFRRTLAALPVEVVRLGRSGTRGLGTDAGPRPDLVVVDLDAPGAAGGGLLASLRQASPPIPVLILSSHGLPSEALQPGWVVLRRPFEAEDLRTAVAKLLEHRTAALAVKWRSCPDETKDS
jgi:DNA-binding NarL/FixJ family response regulator